MRLKYPLRYYLRNKWVDIGGTQVEYTPADVHYFDIVLDEKMIGHLRVIGGYSFVGYKGLELRDSQPPHYAGEM
jgi:hypothetical protein